MGVDCPHDKLNEGDNDDDGDDKGQSICRKDMRQMPSASANAMFGDCV